jgi:hypothetical protein
MSTPYYLQKKSAPWSFKPYDRRRAKRDVHLAGIASRNLSRKTRQMLDESAA